MAKSKYCYVIVNKENGNMFIEGGKLPIYWLKKVAKERCILFSDKYIVHKLELESITKMILKSKKA